ncbi:MAG: hypothetical protein ACREFZ_00160 [Acetobacteraceae bacterium]
MKIRTGVRLLRQLLLSPRRTQVFRSRVNCFLTDSFVQSYLATPRGGDELRLARFGRKVYSQNEEDGIIGEIFRRIGTASRRFVEIGAADGLENNTVWLLLQGWSGVWIEGSRQLVAAMSRKFAPLAASGRLTFKNAFVTRESAQQLEREGLFSGLDLLSVDIDGNDYHVVAALEKLDARLLIVEYNAKFPPPHKFVMKYRAGENLSWDLTDYHGASLAAWTELLQNRGYSLVGCNITGANAFFVRNDLVSGKFREPLTADNHYEPARYWLSSGFVSGHPPNFGEGHFVRHPEGAEREEGGTRRPRSQP